MLQGLAHPLFCKVPTIGVWASQDRVLPWSYILAFDPHHWSLSFPRWGPTLKSFCLLLHDSLGLVPWEPFSYLSYWRLEWFLQLLSNAKHFLGICFNIHVSLFEFSNFAISNLPHICALGFFFHIFVGGLPLLRCLWPKYYHHTLKPFL